MSYYIDNMGPGLQKEVERQLIEDLRHYGVEDKNLVFDYSDVCQEGHGTNYLDGYLESHSSIIVKNNSGTVIANGWMDFIHEIKDEPPYIFWLFLDRIGEDGARIDVKQDNNIPEHVWARVTDATKDQLTQAEGHDSIWFDDPLVQVWKKQKSI